MLSWEEVSRAGQVAERGKNVVIHEFVHKIDMRGMTRSDAPTAHPPCARVSQACPRPTRRENIGA
jgi:MtfA peptidase